MTQTPSAANEREMILRYVFLRCDPIIQQLHVLLQNKLLPILSSSRPLSSSSSSSSSSQQQQQQPQHYNTKMIPLLREISEQLELLYQRILSLVTPTSKSNHHDPNAAMLLQMKQEAIATILDYIMIPVVTTLRTLGQEQYAWRIRTTTTTPLQQPQTNMNTNHNSTDDDDNHSRPNRIRQGMVWKCIIHACSIVTLLLPICFYPPKWISRHSPTSDSQDVDVAPIVASVTPTERTKRLVSYLHVCIGVLPSGALIQQRWFHENTSTTPTSTNTTTTTHTTTNTSLPKLVVESELDNGDDCVCRILSTIQVLIQAITTAIPTTSNISSDQSNNTYHNIPNMCMVLILDSCVAMIEPSSNGTSDKHQLYQEPISGELQFIAVEIIHSLLMLPSPVTTTRITDHLVFDWSSTFPAIFSAVYRRIIRSLRRQSQQKQSNSNTKNKVTTTLSQNITWHCIAIITNLLNVCCGKYRNQSEIYKQSSSLNPSTMILHRLQSLAIHVNTNHQDSTTSTSGTSEKDTTQIPMAADDHFIRQVQQLLPSPLSILFHSYGRVRSSSKIRQQMIHLCRIVSMETYHCWMLEQNRHLLLSSLELVLIFVHDTDVNVATDAKAFLTEYMSKYLHNFNTGDANHTRLYTWEHSEYSQIMKCMIGPRILELIERLPSCIQSGRDDELLVSLQYIGGYLQHVPKRYLRSAFTSESVVQTIRRIFTCIFDVRFEVADPYQRGVVVLNFINNIGDGQTSVATQQRQFLSESMIELTKDVVQLYGSVIGPKHAILLVDGCIADIYRSCMDRVERSISLTGRSQIQWIHEWIGIITFAQCIIRGCFRTTSANGESNTSYVRNRSGFRTKYLAPLLRSILPIITTYPLWDLANFWSTTTDTAKSRADSHFEISAFRGNVVLMCALLEFIKAAVDLLDYETIQSLNTILLYPVLEKMSEQYPGAVRESAYITIGALAACNQHDDIVSYIAMNIESCLIGPMLNRLRVPGGRSLQSNIPIDYDIVCVLDCAATVLRLAIKALDHPLPAESKTTSMASTIVTSMEELTMQLTQRFDYASTIMTYDVATCRRYIQLFDAAIGLLLAVYCHDSIPHETKPLGSTKTNHLLSSSSSSSGIDLDSEPWFQLLAPYTKATVDDQLSPKEGFKKYWKDKDSIMRYENVVAPVDGKKKATDMNCPRDIKFCSYIVWRLGYLLSHPSLQVQHHTCDVLIKCFQWLGYLGSIGSDFLNNATSNIGDDTVTPSSTQTISNAVFRQVHSSWPTISARMKSLCTAVVSKRDIGYRQPVSLFVIETKPASTRIAAASSSSSQTRYDPRTNIPMPGLGEQRTYLSKIIQLITVMMENSDDFMFSRFRDDIYPNGILKLLQHYSYGTVMSISTSKLLHSNRNYFTESDEELLCSVLDCMRRLHMSPSLGRILSTGSFTPMLGHYVIAIVFYQNSNIMFHEKSAERIRNIGTDVLRQMINCDTDALYRPLFELLLKLDPSSPYLDRLRPCPLLIPRKLKRHDKSGNDVETPTTTNLHENSDYCVVTDSVCGINPAARNTTSPSQAVPNTMTKTPTPYVTSTNSLNASIEQQRIRTGTNYTTTPSISIIHELLDMIYTLPEQPIYS